MGEEGDCEELSLELSIGGKYGGKSDNLGDKTRELCVENANCESECDFSESIDLQKRREIEAWRRKREERVRKLNNVVDDKMFVEAQRCGERARDREIREKDMSNGGADELRLSLLSDEKEKKRGNDWLWRKMRCVSATATGDGAKGKRVMGLLYKYDKKEVSIMCVCHGASFSPAEFVEHAGGVDVSHPLRHITLLTSSSSSSSSSGLLF